MISLRKFRVTIGSTILISHFMCLIVMTFLGISYDRPLAEVISNIVSVMPIGSLYAITYYKYITANPNELVSESDRKIGSASFFTQFGVIALFCIVLVVAPPALFKYGTISDVKIYLGGVETVFGVFIARTFGLLFPSEILGEATNDK